MRAKHKNFEYNNPVLSAVARTLQSSKKPGKESEFLARTELVHRDYEYEEYYHDWGDLITLPK